MKPKVKHIPEYLLGHALAWCWAPESSEETKGGKMKTYGLILLAFVGASCPVAAQLNCSTQVRPVKPATAVHCADTTLLCLCEPTGTNCHWDWACQPRSIAEPPAPQVTNPFGVLVEAQREAIRIRIERDRLKVQNAQAEAIRAKEPDEAPDKTADAYNGRYWARFPEAMKTGFIAGFAEAMRFSVEPEKFRFKGTVGDLVKSLDAYYGRQDDLGMPIWIAIRVVKLERDGASELEIEAAMDEYGRRVTPAK